MVLRDLVQLQLSKSANTSYLMTKWTIRYKVVPADLRYRHTESGGGSSCFEKVGVKTESLN